MSDGKGNVQLTFEIFDGSSVARTEELAQDIIKIGKLASNHLRIDDDHVSRLHAMIEAKGPDEVHIIDLGSSSGTLVNGKKVNRAKIASGDELTIGETKMLVTIGAPGEKAAGSAPAAAPQASAPAVGDARAAPKARAAGAKKSSRPPKKRKKKANPFATKSSALPNPFAPPPNMGQGVEAVDESDPDKVQYGILASGPPVAASEVEDPSAQAVEVLIMWGDRAVLHVEHLTPARTFVVGDPGEKEEVDYIIGQEALGTNRFPVVVHEAGASWVVVPPGADGEVQGPSGTSSLDEMPMQSSAEMSGAQQLRLERDTTVKVRYRGFTFQVKEVQAGKKIAAGFNVDWVPLAYVGGAATLFAVIGLIFYFSPPRGGALGGDLIDQNNRLVQYVLNPPETPPEEEPEWLQSNDDEPAGGTGKAHEGESGAMGDTEAPNTNNRYGIEGDSDNPQMAREQAREMARTAGILGTLSAMSGAWNSPTSPYGADQAIGSDPMSALGAMMGDSIGANSGFGGLGLTGTGAGGGGTGQGTIGMGNFGTIGHGGGRGTGQGYGSGSGGLRAREASVPRVRAGSAAVRGSLSREVIRRVVRRHTNEVRFCYEQGLNQRPDLQGRVTVRFIITPTGSVQTSMVAGTSLGNRGVETCIASAVRRWTFPAPDGGGIVIVNYPFMLTSGG